MRWLTAEWATYLTCSSFPQVPSIQSAMILWLILHTDIQLVHLTGKVFSTIHTMKEFNAILSTEAQL